MKTDVLPITPFTLAPETVGSPVELVSASASQIFDMAELDQICFDEGTCYSPWTFNYILEHSNAEGFSLYRENRLMGFILYRKEGRSIGSLITIDVDPEERGRGIGSLLLLEAEFALARKQVTQVRLQVAVENETAIRFYAERGYKRKRFLSNYYGSGKNGYLMAKRISKRESPDSP